MGQLIFKADALRRVCEHSIKAPEQQQPVPAPALALVKHDGIYLKSNGLPDGQRFVVYAQGCNPIKDSQWYDLAKDAVGTDDSVDILPWAKELLALVESGAHSIILTYQRKKTP